MPHSKKKKPNASAQARARAQRKSKQNQYIMVGVIAAIIVAAAGAYVYYSYHNTTVTTTSTTSGGLIYAELNTSQGSIEVELFQSLVPATVNNFVSLAESGFYNNLVWHRLQPGFVIQTGDPASRGGNGNPCKWGETTPTTTIPFESVSSLPNDAGYLGMASTGPKLGGYSQFYINLVNNPSLNGDYAVFGKIISSNGLSIANKIAALPEDTACGNSGAGAPPADPSEAMLISVEIVNQTSTSSST